MPLRLILVLCLAGVPTKADLAKATHLVEQAVELFRAQRYIAAAELFIEAHDLSGLPAPLRNAAKAFEKGGDTARALESWRAYRELPDLTSAEKGEAEAEIARFLEHERSERALKEAEAARQKAEEAARNPRSTTATAAAARTATAVQAIVMSSQPVSEPRRERGPSVGAWTALGVGGAVLTASLVLFVHASSRTSDLDTKLSMTADGKIIGISANDATTELASINRERRWSGVALGVGALLALFAAAWLYLDD